MRKYDFRVGDRVELHPACDLWMMGARFGEVIKLTTRGVRVKLDKLSRPVTFPNDLLVGA